jgi:hypothetical protein
MDENQALVITTGADIHALATLAADHLDHLVDRVRKRANQLRAARAAPKL